MFKFDILDAAVTALTLTLMGSIALLAVAGGSLLGSLSVDEVSTTSFESKVQSLALEACGKAKPFHKTTSFTVWTLHAEASMTWDESGKLLSCVPKD